MRSRIRGQQWFDPPTGLRFDLEVRQASLEQKTTAPLPVSESGWWLAVPHYEVIDLPHAEKRTISQKV